MFRPSGVALVPAVVVFALMHRREGRLSLLIPAAFWFLTFVAVNAALPVAVSYADQVAFDPMGLVRTALVNLWAYRFAVFESHLYPFTRPYLSDLYHVMTLVLMVIGLIAWFPRLRSRFLFVFCVWYFSVPLVFTATVVRYLWPLFPVYAFGMLKGAQLVLSFFSRGRLAETAVRSTVAATVGFLAILVVGPTLASGRPVPFIAEPEMRDLIARTRSIGPEGRLAFFNPRVLTLLTDVPAMGLFEGSPAEIVEELCDKGITHVVAGDFGTQEPGHASLLAAIEQRPGLFDLAWGNEEFALYLFSRAECVTQPPAADPG